MITHIDYIFDLGLLIGFAFFATILRVQDYPLAPLLLGFILTTSRLFLE